MRTQSIFFLCLAMLFFSGIDSSSRRTSRQSKWDNARCLTEDQLRKAVFSLSGDYNQAVAAQRLLRQASKRSVTCRRRIIAAVMNAMNKPNLDIRRDQASAYLWQEGAILLGDLRATQSLDLLLSHITMTDGEWSSTMRHQPALEGIIRMGPVAVPKLEKLLRNQDWLTRHYAVFCIASIGGLPARRAIERGVANESHPCTKRLMLASIKTIDVKHGGMKFETREWVDACFCRQ
jgi:hypothetical protein